MALCQISLEPLFQLLISLVTFSRTLFLPGSSRGVGKFITYVTRVCCLPAYYLPPLGTLEERMRQHLPSGRYRRFIILATESELPICTNFVIHSLLVAQPWTMIYTLHYRIIIILHTSPHLYSYFVLYLKMFHLFWNFIIREHFIYR